MNTTAVQEVSLWREAWEGIRANWRLFAPWFAGFVFIDFLLMAVFGLSSQQAAMNMQLQMAQQGGAQPDWAMIAPVMGSILALMSLRMLFMCISAYVYPALYLARAEKKLGAQIGVGNFFYWLWRRFLSWLVILSPLFVAAVVSTLLSRILGGGAGVLSTVALILLALCGTIYLWGRYLLVTPLAILKEKPELRKSLALTKGEVNRIFWQSFVLMILLGIGFLVLAIASYISLLIIAQVLKFYAVLEIGSTLINALFSSSAVLFLTVFMCTSYRVLSQEKRGA